MSNPCGGCGAETAKDRCIGCFHNFNGEPAMTESNPTSGVGEVGRWADVTMKNLTAGVAVAILYILSIGPFTYLINRHSELIPYRHLYDPVGWLMGLHPMIDEALIEYQAWFANKAVNSATKEHLK